MEAKKYFIIQHSQITNTISRFQMNYLERVKVSKEQTIISRMSETYLGELSSYFRMSTVWKSIHCILMWYYLRRGRTNLHEKQKNISRKLRFEFRLHTGWIFQLFLSVFCRQTALFDNTSKNIFKCIAYGKDKGAAKTFSLLFNFQQGA